MITSAFERRPRLAGPLPTLTLASALLAVLAACGGEETPALPDVSGLRGTIAYVCEHDDGDNDELCLMNADGTRIRRLTQNPGPDRAPNWSPDGRSLVFNSRRDPHADRPQIYRLDLDGRHVVRVTDSPLEDQRASWTPDGGSVVFQRGNFTTGFELYRQPFGQGAPIMLTDNPGRISAAGEYSPNGRRLVFQSNRDTAGLFPFGSYVMDSTSAAVTRLAEAITDSHDGPRWSPTGDRIAFSAGGNLFVIRVADGQVTPVTDDDFADSAPAWSPDGRMLVFQSDRIDEDVTSLHVIDLDSRAIGTLGPGRTPVWTERVFPD